MTAVAAPHSAARRYILSCASNALGQASLAWFPEVVVKAKAQPEGEAAAAAGAAAAERLAAWLSAREGGCKRPAAAFVPVPCLVCAWVLACPDGKVLALDVAPPDAWPSNVDLQSGLGCFSPT